MDLKETLQYYRKEKGLSQIELAEILEVSRQTISKWETGTVLPSAENLLALSQLYGVPVDGLLNGREAENFRSERSLSLPEPEHPLRSRRRLLFGVLIVLFLSDLLFFFMDSSYYSSENPFAVLTQFARILTCCAIGLGFAWLDRYRPVNRRISLLIAAAALFLGLYPSFMPTPLLWQFYDRIVWNGYINPEVFYPPHALHTFLGWTLCDQCAVLAHMFLVLFFQLGRLWLSRRRTVLPQTIIRQV